MPRLNFNIHNDVSCMRNLQKMKLIYRLTGPLGKFVLSVGAFWMTATVLAQPSIPKEAPPAVSTRDGDSVSVTLPNGYVTVTVEDLALQSTAGKIAWLRTWDGLEWKFNPQWESLSHSWGNLTGSTTADAAGATSPTATGANIGNGASGSGGGCWVWVDDDWQPSTGTVLIGGVPYREPMLTARMTPFNRTIGDSALPGEYEPVTRVNVDYASLCTGNSNSGNNIQELEAVRRINELYLGSSGRMAFNNRSTLEKRAVQMLPALDSSLGPSVVQTGRIAINPATVESGYRWADRGGDWIDYNSSGQVVAYGDLNENNIWLQRDSSGRLLGVVDASGQVLYSLHYQGDLLAEVRDYRRSDNPYDIPGRSVKYEYDQLNRLVKVRDARGFDVGYEYDANHKLTVIRDQEGRQETFEYSGLSVNKRIAPDGGVTTYSFEFDDSNKQFISKIVGPEINGERRKEDYTHNRSGQLVRTLINGRTETEVKFDSGARSEIYTNARGFTSSLTRNEFDQIVGITNNDGTTLKYSYSPLNLTLVSEIDEAAVKTEYLYDEKGNLKSRTQGVGSPEGLTTEYVSNGMGKAVKIITKANVANGADIVWRNEFDLSGQLRKTVDPEGNSREFIYDRLGNLARYIDPLGRETRYEVDAFGNLTKSIDPLGRTQTFEYDKVGNLVSSQDAKGKVIRSKYDSMNRLSQTINATGGLAQFAYNLAGSVTFESDEDGRTRRISHDSFHRAVSSIDGKGNVTKFEYHISDGSPSGILGSLTSPTKTTYPTFTQETRFDPMERPTRQITQYGTRNGSSTSNTGTSYDARGLVTSDIDANGAQTSYVFNQLRQKVEIISSLGKKTQMKYDQNGNVIELKDPEGRTFKFEYDRASRLTQEIMPAGQSTSYTYDATGNLLSKTNALGDTALYYYDAANRLVEVRHKTADGQTQRLSTYSWDANDNFVNWAEVDFSRPVGQQTLSGTNVYNDSNQLVSEQVNYPNPNGTTYKLTYSQKFTAAGKKSEQELPNGERLTYGWSDHGELVSISIPEQGILSIDEFDWTSPKRITFPGGTQQLRGNDGVGKLEGISVRSPQQSKVLELNNTFGSVQELLTTWRSDTDNGLTSVQSRAYNYDTDARLIEITKIEQPQVARNFVLDGSGNRVTDSAHPGSWSYNRNNQLIKRGLGNCGDANVICYEYDEAGNLVRIKSSSGGLQLKYDTQGRLVEARDSFGNLIGRYGYDLRDRRLWKEQFRDELGNPIAKRFYYIYSEEGLVAEASQQIALNVGDKVTAIDSPAITTQYGQRPDGEFNTQTLFIQKISRAGISVYGYYHHDHLGSPLLATDLNGSIVWAGQYDAFGSATIVTPLESDLKPSIESNLRLPGQYYDSETGLHYNFRRYYDPAVGRYVTPDPLGTEGGANLYLYAAADPLNVSDTTGELPIILVPVAFCARFPRVCAAIFACVRNPDRCRKGFCRVIHPIYKAACNVPGCKPGDGPGTVDFKAAAAEGCVLGRQVARTICRGTDKTKSGENHEAEIQKAHKKFSDCMAQRKTCSLR